MSRIGVWAFVFLLTAGLVLACGEAIDTVLWLVSRDYLYSPGEFRALAIRLALLVGSVAGCIATFGAKPLLSVKWTLRFFTGAVGLIGSAAVFSAGVGAVVGKFRTDGEHAETLAPLARVYFCNCLWRTAVAGATLSLLIFAVAAWRKRSAESLASI